LAVLLSSNYTIFHVNASSVLVLTRYITYAKQTGYTQIILNNPLETGFSNYLQQRSLPLTLHPCTMSQKFRCFVIVQVNSTGIKSLILC